MNLQQQIEALLPEKKTHSMAGDMNSIYAYHDTNGFNEALSLCKQSLPKIVELIEKDTMENAVYEIKGLMKVSRTEWEALEDLLSTLTKEN